MRAAILDHSRKEKNAPPHTETPEDTLYQALYQAILERRLAPAARLEKSTLAQLFDVSSSTVQRTLQRLALDGAVELPLNQPARVIRPCTRRARELLHARLPLETQVLQLLPPHVENGSLDDLNHLVQCQLDCLQRRDHAGLIEAVNAVHLYLARLAANPWLSEFLARLLRQTALLLALSRTRAYEASACTEQQRLIERLAAGDRAGARAVMEHHLRDLFARLRFTPPPTTDLQAAFAGKMTHRDEQRASH